MLFELKIMNYKLKEVKIIAAKLKLILN